MSAILGFGEYVIDVQLYGKCWKVLSVVDISLIFQSEHSLPARNSWKVLMCYGPLSVMKATELALYKNFAKLIIFLLNCIISTFSVGCLRFPTGTLTAGVPKSLKIFQLQWARSSRIKWMRMVRRCRPKDGSFGSVVSHDSRRRYKAVESTLIRICCLFLYRLSSLSVVS